MDHSKISITAYSTKREKTGGKKSKLSSVLSDIDELYSLTKEEREDLGRRLRNIKSKKS